MDCSPPLSMGFSRQEYCSGLPCPPPGDLPNLGIEPRSPALQVDSEPPGKPMTMCKLASGKLLCSTGSSAQCSVMTKKGVMELGWDKSSRGRGYMYTYS